MQEQKSIIRKGVSVRQDPLIVALSTPIAAPETVDRNGRLYSSQVGFCARSGFFSATEKYEYQQTISSVYYTRIGNAIHSVVKDSLEANGLLLGEEARIPQGQFNLGGYIDAVIKMNDQVSIVEVKSCGKLPAEPHESHYSQASLYAAIVGLPFHIVYVSRNVMGWNSLQIGVFNFPVPIDPPQSLFNMIYASMAVDAGSPPSVPFDNDRGCSYCDHYHRCWKTAYVANDVEKPAIDAKIRVKASLAAKAFMQPEEVAKRQFEFLSAFSVPD